MDSSGPLTNTISPVFLSENDLDLRLYINNSIFVLGKADIKQQSTTNTDYSVDYMRVLTWLEIFPADITSEESLGIG